MAPNLNYAERWTENRPRTRGGLSQGFLREVWARRELVFFLALRDYKLRYTQAVLGVAWVLLQPLVAAAIFYGIFRQVLDAPSDGVPYLAFVYPGLALWSYLSQAVSSASESLAEHAGLVTKVYFPRLVAPAASVLPGLVDLAVALAVLGVLIPVYGITPSLALLSLPLWILLAVAVALGVGLWLSALNAQYRDVRYGLSFVLQIWFFASPIAYSSSVVDGAWRYIYALNPVTGLIDGFRWSLVDAHAPGAEDLLSLAVTLAILATGLLYFLRVERRLADVI